MSAGVSPYEAVVVLETSSIARGFVVLDAVVKRAPVSVKIARPVTPGKFLLLFGGSVEATAEGLDAARSAAASDVLDELFLPGAHKDLLPAIDQVVVPHQGEAVGIAEFHTVAAGVRAADVALKAVDVSVLRLHLAVGVGGKSWFSLAGPVADIEAALEAVREDAHPDKLVALELLAMPHAEVRGFLS